jgi:hypothetical protein
MQPFQIYNATFAWNGCQDMRPWLIIDLRPSGLVGCLPISSHCYSGSCFPLDRNDPDFRATGLNKSCYLHDDRIYDLSFNCFGKYRGELSGDLLARFRDYSGL